MRNAACDRNNFIREGRQARDENKPSTVPVVFRLESIELRCVVIESDDGFGNGVEQDSADEIAEKTAQNA